MSAEKPDASRRVLYGRRSGRRLRPAQRARLAALLPRLEVALPEPGAALDPGALFDPPRRAVWLEVGFGGGEHLAAQARAHPEIGFIGCEPFAPGVAKLLAEIEAGGLANVRIFRDDARLLLDRLAPASLARVFILFPDPWPKARHHRRRIVCGAVLARLAAALADDGDLRLATDDPGYLDWMLVHALAEPALAWTARRAADWCTRPADWPATRYEEKALRAGRRCWYLRLVRRTRDKSLAGGTADPIS